MTRPANQSRKQADLKSVAPSEGVKAITFPEGMEVEGEIKLKAVETPAERKHRHQMEVRRFWVEKAPIHLTAIGIAVSGTVLALVLTLRPGSSLEEKKWAFSILSHLLIAVAGFAFGKAAN